MFYGIFTTELTKFVLRDDVLKNVYFISLLGVVAGRYI
jgi:hypothetical protein